MFFGRSAEYPAGYKVGHGPSDTLFGVFLGFQKEMKLWQNPQRLHAAILACQVAN